MIENSVINQPRIWLTVISLIVVVLLLLTGNYCLSGVSIGIFEFQRASQDCAGDVQNHLPETGEVDHVPPVVPPTDSIEEPEKPRPPVEIPTPQLTESQIRTRSFQEYFDGRISQGVVLAIRDENTSRGTSQLQGFMIQKLKSYSSLDESYFSSGFITSVFFDDLFRGDPLLVQESELMKGIGTLIIGTMSFTECARRSRMNRNLISCDLIFSFVKYGKSGSIDYRDVITEVGAAFSEVDAQRKAIELLAERHAEAIFHK